MRLGSIKAKCPQKRQANWSILAIWEFPKIRANVFWGPYYTDHIFRILFRKLPYTGGQSIKLGLPSQEHRCIRENPIERPPVFKFPPPPSPPRYFIRVEAKGSNTWQFCSCSRAIQSRSGALWSRFQQTSANVGSLGLRPLRLKLNVSRFLSALLFTRSLVLKGSFVYRSSTAFKLAPNIYLNDSVDAPGPLIT